MNVGVNGIRNKRFNLNVRVVNFENDKNILIQFRKDTEIENTGTLDGFDFKAYLNRVRERVNKLPIGQLIIEKDNIPVGQMGFGITNYESIEIGYVDLLYLLPDYRGKGLGKELIRYADKFFSEINVSEYHLRVSSNNHIAINLYTHLGMVKIEEEYPENEKYPVWRMRKVL
ncbi:GNAT family N-acetyltransferase [Cytobacillus massiliigabonensis]|uniref:GNAT family N-acetyltransferase n=1 Tax=Cytobacillus massiliigabonensis TaxID=1871011 RepID=UPI000C846FED|nr:GNAT family N-acetyltransferase [Cytobacillus massiliigabonensis]